MRKFNLGGKFIPQRSRTLHKKTFQETLIRFITIICMFIVFVTSQVVISGAARDAGAFGCGPMQSSERRDHDADTGCGVGPCQRSSCLAFLANKYTYIIIYGIMGTMRAASNSYSNAIISTIEKRFKIPTKMSGLISVGNDVSSLFATLLLSYYLGRGHRPRWMAMGSYCVALYCFLTMLPHVIWGPGEDALALTEEHGATADLELAEEILKLQKRKTLCRTGYNQSVPSMECFELSGVSDSGMMPAALLFLAQFISGLGDALYFTLGLSYLDDNVGKSNSPLLISISYFLRMLGPAVGFSLASYFLMIYVSPSLTPAITNKDPRWLGAWWAGWILLGSSVAILGTFLGMFPRTLPSAAQKQQAQKMQTQEEPEQKKSLRDMKVTLTRIMTNKIFVINIVSSMLYSFGFMPFWVYTTKYMEIQYHVSASIASFFTGSVGLVCSALGVLISGIAISYFKPRARYLAAWNVLLSVISVITILSYSFLGCEQSDVQSSQMATYTANMQQQCNVNCQCDFVKYSPVCSEDGSTTFISACHAGCKDQITLDGMKVYTDCSCIQKDSLENTTTPELITWGGYAYPGPCPVDCSGRFYMFVVMMCLLKFCTASGRASNMLVAVRCVEPRDKAVSLGVDVMLFNLFVYIPSPILFGAIIDSTCLVWGQTCTGKGNCWQYDGEAMRTLVNYSAAAFVALGTAFDIAVWYYVKYLQIFDDKSPKKDEGEVGVELLRVSPITEQESNIST